MDVNRYFNIKSITSVPFGGPIGINCLPDVPLGGITKPLFQNVNTHEAQQVQAESQGPISKPFHFDAATLA